MAKFKVIIREKEGQKTKDGTYNVKIRILHKGEGRDIGTDIYVTPDQLESGTIVDHPNAMLYNITIRNTLNLYDQEVINLGGRINYMDARALMKHLRGVDILGRDGDFFFMADRIVEGLKKTNRISYAKSIEQTICELKAHSGPFLLFTEISPEYLEGFGIAMKLNGKSTNTVAIHYRNTRMIFNKAIDAGKADLSEYPFRRFKIKQGESRDKDMDIEDLVKLRDADLDLVSWRRSRDLFMLSFYVCGLNFKDLLYAKKTDIRKGKLILDRQKTGQPIKIKIQPPAQEIIDRYHGDKFLLSILEKKLKTAKPSRKTIIYKDVTDQTNAKMKEIAKHLGIPDRLSTYYARHSWSSIAFNECGVSEEIIGLALGHASPRKITAGYIRKKYEQVDRANQMVIDSLND